MAFHFRYFSTSLKVYNSLTKKKELLVTDSSKPLSWYICGPTVYDKSHLGHARTYVCFDIMHRLLTEYFGIPVTLAMGMTDIDDKIINKAGVDHRKFSYEMEMEFRKDMEKLNVKPPVVYLRVSEHLPEIVRFITVLLEKKFAYKGLKTNSIYFDSQSFVNAGFTLNKLRPKGDPDNFESDSSDTQKEKLSPKDFALWKIVPEKDIGYSTIFGYGRPGWHIECSAAITSFFGSNLDMHSGGIDLQFPHHENEIYQCEAYFGDPKKEWCRHFSHTGHLFIENRKMSKSLKNFITIEEYLSQNSSDLFRMICLSKHYTLPLDYTLNLNKEASNKLALFKNFIALCEAKLVEIKKNYDGNFRFAKYDSEARKLIKSFDEIKIIIHSSLSDDFDTVKVLSELSRLFSATNLYFLSVKFINVELIESILQYTIRLVNLFGFQNLGNISLIERKKVLIRKIADFRSNIKRIARNPINKKLLSLCDEMRNRDLNNLGVTLADGANDMPILHYSKDFEIQNALIKFTEFISVIKDEALKISNEELLRLCDQNESFCTDFESNKECFKETSSKVEFVETDIKVQLKQYDDSIKPL